MNLEQLNLEKEKNAESFKRYDESEEQLKAIIDESDRLLENRTGCFTVFDLEQIKQVSDNAKDQLTKVQVGKQICQKEKLILECHEQIQENIEQYNRDILEINQSNIYSFSIPYFEEEEGLTGIFAQTEPVWSKMEGYESHSFLPVYRIDEEDHIDADELFSIIHNKKVDIVETATESLIRLNMDDPLRPLFAEAILLVEEEKYFAAQAVLSIIYGLIREHRLKVVHFLPFGENHFLTTWGPLRDFVLRIGSDYTEEDVKLALMTLYVFANTNYFPENHDPQRLPSRNGMIHKDSIYFSKYNCLCFLLYVSEVFDLIYRLESMPDSIVKPKIGWDA